MMINLNTGEGLQKRLLFPDNQPHIQLPRVNEGTDVNVIVSLTDSKRVMELQLVANAIHNNGYKANELFIPYLMAARFDRVMEHGDSFDLQVVAEIINNCKFKRVFLFDPHSDVAAALIKNVRVNDNRALVQSYNRSGAILIIPDAGASKKAAKYREWNKNIVDEVQCVKHRDLSTGNIILKVLEPEKCNAENCVIIDDLCDGGGTFLQIANQINPFFLTLIVSHGIFSKGFHALEENFDEIITTNSYRESYDSTIVKTIKLI